MHVEINLAPHLSMLLSTLLAALLPTAIPATGCDDAYLNMPVQYGFDYDRDLQPIWNQYCANCHVSHDGFPSAGLDLDPPWSFFNLFDTPSAVDPTIDLVEPGDPLASLLFRKLNCAQPGPLSNGQQMPLGRPALSAELQARVFDWIAVGAPLQTDTLFASRFEQR